MPHPRIVPHQDGAGVIEAVGEGVPEARIGERVWLYEAQLGRPFGTAADYVVLPAARSIRLPESTSFIEGAALGVPAMTAHRAVFADGPVAGQTVLVTGGAGAVGFYAIQFARQDGARVIATVGSDAQATVAREAGTELVLDRRDPALADKIRDGVGGVDRIVEVAFGANLETSLKVLSANGVIAAYPSDAEPTPALPFWPLVRLDATIRFVLVYAMTREAHEAAAKAISEGLEAGWLKHNIARVLPLERIAEAHALVESGTAGGKVVLEI